jgi:hypothetical protein
MAPMASPVANPTQRNQVFFNIVAERTSRNDMVNL